MKGETRLGLPEGRALFAALLALGIFAADMLSPLQGAVAVLYTVVILFLASTYHGRAIVAGGVVTALLATLAFLAQHHGAPFGGAGVRLIVSLVAIGVTTGLCLRNRRADAERRASEERYRTIFHSAGFAIWESDWSETHAAIQRARAQADGDLRGWLEANPEFVRVVGGTARINDMNQAAQTLFGLRSRFDLVGHNLTAHYTPQAEAALGEAFIALSEGKMLVESEAPFRTLDGEIVDTLLRVSVPPGEDDWKRILVMAIDVTARKPRPGQAGPDPGRTGPYLAGDDPGPARRLHRP